MDLSPNQARLMMLRVADAIIEAEPMLSQADRDLGDGDHGLGMKRGMEAVKAQLEPMEPSSVEQVFITTGTAMMTSMGGASGAIFGTVSAPEAKLSPDAQPSMPRGLPFFSKPHSKAL